MGHYDGGNSDNDKDDDNDDVEDQPDALPASLPFAESGTHPRNCFGALQTFV